jgi:hypothetical protein
VKTLPRATAHTRSCLGFEWYIGLEIRGDAVNGPDHSGHRDQEAEQTEALQRQPPARVLVYLLLPDVHLHGVVHGERPEPYGPEEPQDVVEEGHQDGQHRAHHHERRPPRQPEHVDAELAGRHGVVAGQELGARPPRAGPPLHGGEDRLAVHLVRADQVHHDADVGEVDQPVGLVEAEPGQDVPRRGVAERRVAEAAGEHVEPRGGRHAQQGRLLHRLVLSRRRLHSVLKSNS